MSFDTPRIKIEIKATCGTEEFALVETFAFHPANSMADTRDTVNEALGTAGDVIRKKLFK